MTNDDFLAIIRQPDSVKAEYVDDLKEMNEVYPYFVQSRLLFIKALQLSNSIHFASNLKESSIYCYSRRWLYYYLNPDKILSTETFQRTRSGKISGDYFEMISFIESEGGDSKQSLKELAEKLKSARSQVTKPLTQKIINVSTLVVVENKEDINYLELKQQKTKLTIITEISEEYAKKLIIERKYEETKA